MNEIIKVNFDENTSIKYVEGLTQWDYGQILEVTGLNLDESTVEVHFSLNEKVGEAKRNVAVVKDNTLITFIPSTILQPEVIYDYYAYAFIYISNASTGKTVKKIAFTIESRPKPEDFVTPDEPDIVGQLIEMIDGKVDKEEGKGLSSNDFTQDEKEKLNNLPTADELEEKEKTYAKKSTTLKGYGITDAYTKNEIDQSMKESEDKANTENKNTFANAVKATASGEVIRVDDVSPIEHTAKVKVRGKNLVPYPYFNTENTHNGGTFIAQTDGGILASGTPTGYASFIMYKGKPIIKSGMVTVSISGECQNISCDLILRDDSDNVLGAVYLAAPTKMSASINLDEYPNANNWTFTLKRTSTNKEMSGIIYPQIELGDTVTEYEPYINPADVTVTRCGKNEFDSERWYNELKENNGNIFKETINGVEYYKFRPGNASTYPFMEGEFEENTSYTLSFLGIYDNATYQKATGFLLKYTDESSVFCIIDGATEKLYSVTTDSNKTLKCIRIYYAYNEYAYVRNLQLEKGNTATEYEPYKGETYTPAADGTVNISSVAPTMTLLTDTEGVNIECEYNQDTNKAIGNVKADLSELDRVVTELAKPEESIALVDATTDKVYKLYVENGLLKMEVLE